MTSSCFIRCTVSLTYYGLSLNSVNLGGNEYLSFTLSGLIEIPSYVFCVLTVDRLGRRNIVAGLFILSGVSLLSTMAVAFDKGILQGFPLSSIFCYDKTDYEIVSRMLQFISIIWSHFQFVLNKNITDHISPFFNAVNIFKIYLHTDALYTCFINSKFIM